MEKSSSAVDTDDCEANIVVDCGEFVNEGWVVFGDEIPEPFHVHEMASLIRPCPALEAFPVDNSLNFFAAGVNVPTPLI